jgi:hypothetical protein
MFYCLIILYVPIVINDRNCIIEINTRFVEVVERSRLAAILTRPWRRLAEKFSLQRLAAHNVLQTETDDCGTD